MNRIDRISAILIQLQSRRVVKAQDIAGRFNISLRTVYRDIRTLEQAGVPLIGEAGVGYSIMDGFRLPPVMFTRDEALAFLTAEKLVAQLTDGANSMNYSSAMFKIKAVLNPAEKELLESMEDRIEVFRRPGDLAVKPDLHLLQPVLKSINQSRVLLIQYHSQSKLETTERQVEPMGIFYTDNYWHLIAWCRMRNDYRDFRFDRITSISESEILFENIHPGMKEYLETNRKNSVSQNRDMQLIVIRVERTQACWLDHQKYYQGFISQVENGELVEMTFLSSSLESFARWYIMFGDHATVVEPPALKEKIHSMLSLMLKKI